MNALAEHIAQMPPMPRPFNPNTPEAIAYQRAMQWWVDKKGDLERQLVTLAPLDQTPHCAPRADYEWRDIPARRSSEAQREVWRAKKQNQTPEQRANRLEAKRLRDKAKRERAVQIREGLGMREQDAA